MLDESGVDNPLLDARVFLGKVLDKSDVFVIINPDFDISNADAELFFSYIKRRAAGEPLAYIIGEREFMSIPFRVSSAVLIPRPDTEHLAELAIELCNKYGYKNVADLCTGSGALAIAVAMNCPEAKVTGYDISSDALEVANLNKHIHHISNAEFKVLDVLSDLECIDYKYDLVISNPPYISGEEMNRLDKTVWEYEPHLALYGGDDGLGFYRVISSCACSFLVPGGVLAFEVGHTQSRSVAEIMSDNFRDIQLKKDYADIERVVWGKLK